VPAVGPTFRSPSVALAAALVAGGPYGSGAAQVWVLRPAGPVRDVVVFAHGWKNAPPSGSSWVDQFRPWLDHLVAGGSAVLFPRYQLGAGDAQDVERSADLERGLRTGFAALGRPHVPVVAVGYSFGASLVLAYAADARAWRLPVPAAVDAIFPAGPVPGTPLPPLPTPTRVLIQVGDEDTEAGDRGALFFWRWLAAHVRKRYQVVRSAGSFRATHAAPKLATRAARRAFWAPLDDLIRGS
jgi:hypothetical protein